MSKRIKKLEVTDDELYVLMLALHNRLHILSMVNEPTVLHRIARTNDMLSRVERASYED